MNVFAFIFKYLRKTKMLATIIMLSVIGHAVILRFESFYMARALGLLPEYVKDSALLYRIILALIIYIALIAVDSLLDLIVRIAQARFLPYFNSLIFKDLFRTVHQHSIAFFQEEMSGKIAAKVKNVVSGTEQICRMTAFALVNPLIGVMVSIIFIMYVNLWLGVIFAVMNIIFIALACLIRYRVGKYAYSRARLMTETEGIFIDTVTNSDLLKSFANYFYEKHYFYHSLRQAVRAEQTENRKDSVYNWIGNSCFDLMRIMYIGLIFYFWFHFHLPLEGVLLCFTLISRMVHDMYGFGWLAGEFSRAYGQVKDGLEMIYTPCTVVDCQEAKNIKMKNKSISYENICFHYNNKENLFNRFNLHIKSGEKVALVGHSGSGKSTLIKLLVRYYDVQNGRITVGGQDIAKVRQESLRAKIAVIPQETTLFNRTIMENIRYGNVRASDEDVIRAAKLAYADEFIRQLPNGYESKVGERGVMLSGGERQRIAIARAILKDAPILILDEATSSLDSESEYYIQKSLRKLMKNKTVVAIAHRLSTLKEMDRLLVMDNGKIVEQGTHEDLLHQKGIYAKFYQRQNLGRDTELDG
ncbi:MAG: ABC transporter ATP-binding protein [Alphaproteobacteria bacterium]|nr:ABC transporter ATP-binding protein [Alphaproteobacteria bacterium]